MSDITFKLNKPTLFDFLLKSTHALTFPFFNLNLKVDPKMQDFSLELKVGSKLYQYLKEVYSSENLLSYISFSNGQIGFWAFDMIAAINTLSNLKIIDKPESWIKKSRDAISQILINEQVKEEYEKSNVLDVLRSILQATNILQDVEDNKILPLIINEAITSKDMDSNTLISRLGLSIYHAKSATNESVIPAIEDPSSLYLNLSQSKLFKQYLKEFQPINDLPIEMRLLAIKVFIPLVISAYLFYREKEK